MKNERGISSIVLIIMIILLILALVFVLESNKTDNNSKSSSSINTSTLKPKTYGLGDTIIFDGLELTFDSTYSFSTIINQFSEYNGRSVVRVGVNVRNLSNEKNHLNMFYYDLFGSKGIELDSITAYFDDSIDFAGDLKTNASYKTYFYFLYDGNGNYSIDFNNYSQDLSVEFRVTK